MTAVLQGVISQTDGLKEALEIVMTLKEINSGVLEIRSPGVAGRIGVAWGRFITGAALDSGETGRPALRVLLALRAGRFTFVDTRGEPVMELRQALGIDLNGVAPYVPDSLSANVTPWLFDPAEHTQGMSQKGKVLPADEPPSIDEPPPLPFKGDPVPVADAPSSPVATPVPGRKPMAPGSLRQKLEAGRKDSSSQEPGPAQSSAKQPGETPVDFPDPPVPDETDGPAAIPEVQNPTTGGAKGSSDPQWSPTYQSQDWSKTYNNFFGSQESGSPSAPPPDWSRNKPQDEVLAEDITNDSVVESDADDEPIIETKVPFQSPNITSSNSRIVMEDVQTNPDGYDVSPEAERDSIKAALAAYLSIKSDEDDANASDAKPDDSDDWDDDEDEGDPEPGKPRPGLPNKNGGSVGTQSKQSTEKPDSPGAGPKITSVDEIRAKKSLSPETPEAPVSPQATAFARVSGPADSPQRPASEDDFHAFYDTKPILDEDNQQHSYMQSPETTGLLEAPELSIVPFNEFTIQTDLQRQTNPDANMQMGLADAVYRKSLTQRDEQVIKTDPLVSRKSTHEFETPNASGKPADSDPDKSQSSFVHESQMLIDPNVPPMVARMIAEEETPMMRIPAKGSGSASEFEFELGPGWQPQADPILETVFAPDKGRQDSLPEASGANLKLPEPPQETPVLALAASAYGRGAGSGTEQESANSSSRDMSVAPDSDSVGLKIVYFLFFITSCITTLFLGVKYGPQVATMMRQMFGSH